MGRLWHVEWTAQYSNIGCLIDHTSPTWALLDITNIAITQKLRDEQVKLSYWQITSMAEVAKSIIMANVLHQRLQGSYFSICYLFSQNPVNQMYVLSYCVNFKYVKCDPAG